MRVLAIIAAAVAAILLFLLSSASANTDLFARHYPLLLVVNGVVALALVVLVGVQLRQLWRELRAGVFGSRLKSRLLGMLALMAVLPGVLVYGVSMQFAVTSIESWFDVRVDSALEGGLDLARAVLDTQQSELFQRGRTMALDLADNPGPQRLNRLREQAGVRTATLIGPNGQVLLSSSAEIGSLLPPLPTTAQLRQARGSQGLAWLEGDAEGGFTLHALAPVASRSFGEESMLQLTQPVAKSIAHSAESVEAAYRDYQGLQLGRGGLKRIYTLTLTLTLLLGLFAAVALAFFLARRLAEPLLILAEGTQAVAAGDFTPRAILTTPDELGVLTQSFNRMTQQLNEARQETERHRSELESARTYLESVLTNLSAGVLAFDSRFRLRAANRGALNILGDTLAKFEELPLDQWPRQQTFAQAVLAGFDQGAAEWQRQLELESAQGVPQTLLVRGSILPTGRGYVVVFDDISQLISAQRSAAWGEVARRLAHEIKNPLTPIQLSAERLQRKLSSKLEGPELEMLARSTRTIVNQVEAMKNMVNDFRDYARLPPPVLAAVDLNALVEEVLLLHESGRMRIATRLAADLPPVLADANQLRQVIHNLLANAQDALTDVATPQTTLFTRLEGNRVLLSVSDNGPGFPPQTLARAFEPYVTSKAKGTGLGLAIVKKIVDEHHGEVRLLNPEGGGAEVALKLPLAA
ncbi:sensor histidine kinase [Denitratisoma oestradiolicum]|uniref:histidine kinase n=1 Tax=Denitratisoma oestradiolicum TaxID=311182 RepID=A0A6S6Y5P6_9PROT|nr:ATP-binding protein [Denitratisoma oestradiolicum]TWO81814.1 PAS domain-containing sensor histidine kinase [Denitratisoma oestradiolicum]CAB1370780.1 PAS domain-containing sensor histidine kinase [Denitratisoma oestradiolicum]